MDESTATTAVLNETARCWLCGRLATMDDYCFGCREFVCNRHRDNPGRGYHDVYVKERKWVLHYNKRKYKLANSALTRLKSKMASKDRVYW